MGIRIYIIHTHTTYMYHTYNSSTPYMYITQKKHTMNIPHMDSYTPHILSHVTDTYILYIHIYHKQITHVYTYYTHRHTTVTSPIPPVLQEFLQQNTGRSSLLGKLFKALHKILEMRKGMGTLTNVLACFVSKNTKETDHRIS